MASDPSDLDDKLPLQGRFNRFRKLAGLSAQLGADVLKSGAKRLVGEEPELLSRAAAEKLVSTLGELKGAAMKLGQAVSMDTEFLSPEVRQVIARLQNEAPPMPYEVVGAGATFSSSSLASRKRSIWLWFHSAAAAAGGAVATGGT